MTRHLYLDPSHISHSGETCLATISRLYEQSEIGRLSDESLVIACASAVEAHFDRVLTVLIQRNQCRGDQFFEALLGEVREEIFRTWDSRLSWLKRAFGISIAGDTATQNYRCVIELRNSLIHGEGRLTDFQLRDFGRACALKRQMSLHMGVQFNGRVILLTPDVGIRAVRLSREMVHHLDKR
jgi:hypothetical protein